MKLVEYFSMENREIRDPLTRRGQELVSLKNRIPEIQNTKMQTVTVSLGKNGEPKLQFRDRDLFDKLIEEETTAQGRITSITSKFEELEQVLQADEFALRHEVHSSYELAQKIVEVSNERLKLKGWQEDLVHDLSGTRRMPVPEIIKTNEYLEFERRIAGHDSEIAGLQALQNKLRA